MEKGIGKIYGVFKIFYHERYPITATLMNLKIIGLLFITASLNVVSQTLSKIGLRSFPPEYSLRFVQNVFSDFYILTGIIFQVMSMIVWFVVLSQSRLYLSLPVLYGLIFLIIAPVSYIVLKEPLDFKAVLGIAFIYMGILIISLSKKQ
ncbi:MAG: hypothetical protein HQL06_09075 [Nitrospirae bacterium]|nr:hypothetical protein [Nitrospirota bacterium]